MENKISFPQKKLLNYLLVFMVSLNIVHAFEYFIIYFDLVDVSTLYKKIFFLFYLIIISVTTLSFSFVLFF